MEIVKRSTMHGNKSVQYETVLLQANIHKEAVLDCFNIIQQFVLSPIIQWTKKTLNSSNF
ncbi:CLUMA_CG005025, isoform A [Clunio marinus]|uniref:CLUMA_CG005025, isoform A n=1 Tax=Clunio marinus TaxID=568069 RepID=A0A1J1HTF6_9DIPT|nr:CLUMA_CG005025, isoform A [Clunio marinus]